MFSKLQSQAVPYVPQLPRLKIPSQRQKTPAPANQVLAPGQLPTPADLAEWQGVIATLAGDEEQQRIAAGIADAMWGKGIGFPGAHTIWSRLIDQMPLHPASVVLDTDCGAGGLLQIACHRYGAKGVGLGDRIPATTDFDMRSWAVIPDNWVRRFDVVLAPMMLSRIRDKQAALAQINGLLRPRGHLALVEMTVDRPAMTTAFGRWMDHEPVRPAPAPQETLRNLLDQLHCTVVRVVDVTSLYAEAIRAGLQNLSALAQGRSSDDPVHTHIQSAVIDWSTRLAVLGQGVRVHAFHAVRPPEYGDLSFAQSHRGDYYE